MPLQKSKKSNNYHIHESLSQHELQLYNDTNSLIQTLSEFVRSGLNEGNDCLVIATQHNLHVLWQILANDIDITMANMRGQYMTMDAHATLSSFMVQGMPDWNRFSNVVGNIIDQLGRNHRPLQAYGEMVGILWLQNNFKAVIKLEQYWNDLLMLRKSDFTLHCGYTLDQGINQSQTLAMHKIKQQHSARAKPNLPTFA